MLNKSHLLIVVACLMTCAIPGVLSAEDLTTSFEFEDLSGEFTLGDPPLTVTFTGGEAKSVGNFALYHSGFSSFMIGAGNTGTVTFETPAKQVSLFFRDENASVQSVLTLFDTDGIEVGSFNGTDVEWTEVAVTVGEGMAPIGSITLQHNGGSGYAVIDDFSFCAVARTGLEDPIPEPIPLAGVDLRLRTLATGLTAPNWGTFAPVSGPAGRARLYVTDQPGILWAINVRHGRKKVFLDVRDRLVDLGIAGPGTFDERGLLGAAFHPDYGTNGLLYTYTSEPAAEPADFSTVLPGEANHQTVITEWQVPEPRRMSSVVDPSSARVLLRIDQPQFNHDGGVVAFGPDGMLYISLGDGGAADDQGNGHGAAGNGQDPSNPLGSILRLDPLGNNSANGQYGIPADNPFVGLPGYVEETFAYGFRNPFRFSFDRASGLLIVGDVGQNDIEEIGVVFPGDNHGWNLKEGTFCFDPNGDERGFVTDCESGQVPEDLVDPIAEYDHDEGIAVIGGFVYRGRRARMLRGRYIFGDLARTFNNDGRLFMLEDNLGISELGIQGQDGLGMFLLGFGEDAAGDLYVLTNSTGVPFGETGTVLKIVGAR
jgi:glucose/arabinose dehydrogenase